MFQTVSSLNKTLQLIIEAFKFTEFPDYIMIDYGY